MLDGMTLPKNKPISENESNAPSDALMSCAFTSTCHLIAPNTIAKKYDAVAKSKRGKSAEAMMPPTSRKFTRVKMNASSARVTRILRRLMSLGFIQQKCGEVAAEAIA